MCGCRFFFKNISGMEIKESGVFNMDNEERELEVLDEGIEDTEEVRACCSGTNLARK
jgi:putative radical SAM-modified peptide